MENASSICFTDLLAQRFFIKTLKVRHSWVSRKGQIKRNEKKLIQFFLLCRGRNEDENDHGFFQFCQFWCNKSAHGDLGIFFWASWETQAFASEKISDFSSILPEIHVHIWDLVHLGCGFPLSLENLGFHYHNFCFTSHAKIFRGL